MLQNALETLTDAWQKNQDDLSPSSSTSNAAASQISQLTAAAEQLLGNRSELTINRVVSPTQNNDFSYQQRQAPIGGPSCQLADTTLYLGDGSRVRTHYLVLAAGSSFFRSLNQVYKQANYLVQIYIEVFCLKTWIKGRIRTRGFLRIFTIAFLIFLALVWGSNSAWLIL